jgi:alpha-glucosidase
MAQQRDRRSLLSLYRELIALRRHERCLLQGEYWPRRAQNDVFSFERRGNDAEFLVSLNICAEPRLWKWEGRGVQVLSTGLDRAPETVEGPMHLKSNEGVIVKLTR